MFLFSGKNLTVKPRVIADGASNITQVLEYMYRPLECKEVTLTILFE